MRIEAETAGQVGNLDSFERQAVAENSRRAFLQQCQESLFVGGVPIAVAAFAEKLCQVAIIKQADTEFGGEQYIAFAIEINGLQRTGWLAGQTSL